MVAGVKRAAKKKGGVDAKTNCGKSICLNKSTGMKKPAVRYVDYVQVAERTWKVSYLKSKPQQRVALNNFLAAYQNLLTILGAEGCPQDHDPFDELPPDGTLTPMK